MIIKNSVKLFMGPAKLKSAGLFLLKMETKKNKKIVLLKKLKMKKIIQINLRK